METNELITLYGHNYNNIDNLLEYLTKKYHPKYFNTFKDFCSHLSLHNNSIEDYTDNYISENESYIVFLFDDYRDFNNATENDNFSDDVIVCFDLVTKKITKYFYTGSDNNYLHDIEAFIR